MIIQILDAFNTLRLEFDSGRLILRTGAVKGYTEQADIIFLGLKNPRRVFEETFTVVRPTFAR